MTTANGTRHASLQRALADERGGQVLFLSHCLLNQNTRYLGGAVCRGAVDAAVRPPLAAGIGIVQMPCPEQRTWGGVLKSRFLWLVDHRGIASAAPLALAVAVPYLRWRYARLARAVARDLDDYVSAGYTVCGLVGVAGSPSCGAGNCLDLRSALTRLTRSPRSPISAAWMNEEVVRPAVRPGDGLFIQALRRELARRHLDVPVTEYALPDPAGYRGRQGA